MACHISMIEIYDLIYIKRIETRTFSAGCVPKLGDFGTLCN